MGQIQTKLMFFTDFWCFEVFIIIGFKYLRIWYFGWISIVNYWCYYYCLLYYWAWFIAGL